MTRRTTKKTTEPAPDPETTDLDRQQAEFETINPTTAGGIPAHDIAGPPWFIAYDNRLLRYVPGWYATASAASRAAVNLEGVPADKVTVESFEPTNTQSVARTT